MIDHLTLTVGNLAESIAFYEKAFAPLGYTTLMRYEGLVGIGSKNPFFWLKEGPLPTQPIHLAFRTKERPAVDAYFAAALAAGARDDGAPGLRPHYHENYYAAFTVDPNGHHLEVVCHEPIAPVRRALPERTSARKASPARKAQPKRKAKATKPKPRAKTPARRRAR